MDTFSDRLTLAFGGETPHSFAKKCGFGDSVLRPYLKGVALPGLEKLVLIAKTAGVNIEWLATGEGPMRPGEEAILLHQSQAPPTTPRQQEHVTDVVNIQELLNMTAEVLTSKTVYRPALAANIKAFHRSIALEIDNQQLMDRVDRLELERPAFEQRLQSLEARLAERDTEERDTEELGEKKEKAA